MKSLVGFDPSWVTRLLSDERPHFGSGCEVACQRFDVLSDACRLGLRSLDPISAGTAILDMLLLEQGYRECLIASGSAFSLTSTLLHKRGNCLGITTLLVGLGCYADLPVRAMLFEGHVCATFPCDGRCAVFDVKRGRVLISRRSVAKVGGKGRGRLLTIDELLAVHLSNRAVHFFAPTKQLDDALRMADKCLSAFPDYVGGRINRARLLMQLDRIEEAADELGRVLLLKPGRRYMRLSRALLSQMVYDSIVCRAVPAAEFSKECVR